MLGTLIVADLTGCQGRETAVEQRELTMPYVFSSDSRRIISAATAVRLNQHTLAQQHQRSSTCQGAQGIDFLDARDLSMRFYWSHPPLAQHVPWRRFTQKRRSGLLLNRAHLTLTLQKLGLCPTRPVLIIGDWEQGWGEEARMLWLLEYAGHEQAYVVEGGWRAWHKEGGGVERGQSLTPSPSDWLPAWQPQVRVTTDQVKQLLGDHVPSLDARSLKEFEGETPYGSRFGGHLIGSIHLPIDRLFKEQHRLKSRSELRHLFTQLGLQPNKPVITYCTGGIRSAFVYLALREAGFHRAMNYDGSWWAWSEDVSPTWQPDTINPTVPSSLSPPPTSEQ